MLNVDGIAKTIKSDSNARHVTVGYRENSLPLYTTRLHIYSAMEMMRTRLAKITGKRNVISNRRGKLECCC